MGLWDPFYSAILVHWRLIAAGLTRPFPAALDAWTYTPLDDTAAAAAAIKARIADREAASGESAEKSR